MEPGFLEILRQSQVFQTLDTSELESLLSSAVPQSFIGGQTLFREGEDAGSLMVLTRGWAVLSRTTPSGRQIQVGMVGPGQVLGEMALLDVAPRSATATVLAPVVALEIKNDHFDRLVEERNPGAVKLLHQLNRLLCQRLRAVTTRIESELSGAMEPPPPIPKSSRRVSAPSLELSVPSLPTPSRDSQPGVAESMRNSVATTVPTFEMARRGGVWKVLWGVKG